MIGILDALGRPLLLRLDAEFAHRVTIKTLEWLPLSKSALDDPRLRVEAFGLAFPNPIGLAAGFDKNGEAAGNILRLGFGFAEIGTVTPRPQPGNPRPRVFRLRQDRAVINRYGFNSAGHRAVADRLMRLRAKAAPCTGLIAVNLGANKDAVGRAADYVAGVKTFAGLADFFVVNISSPNTPGLRDLQEEQALDDLLARVLAARDEVSQDHRTPLLLKIAPDLNLTALDAIVAICRRRHIDGLVVSNTTVQRPTDLRDKNTAQEQGGLSGRPLFEASTRMLAQAFLRVEGQFPLIGVGGIDGAATARAKIEAGAALVELYTGLVYEGIGLIGAISRGLLAALTRAPHQSLSDWTGSKAEDWASGRLAAPDYR